MSDLKLTVNNWGEVLLDKREINSLLRAAGNDVKGKTANLIARSDGGGRRYYVPGAKSYHASTAGNPPDEADDEYEPV